MVIQRQKQNLLRSILAEQGNSGASSFRNSDIAENGGIFLIGYYDDKPIACGAFRKLSRNTAEIKRVFAMKNDIGAAHKIIETLEKDAIKEGSRKLQLETRRINEHAVQFYYNCGYKQCDNYGLYIGREDAICFEKTLTSKLYGA